MKEFNLEAWNRELQTREDRTNIHEWLRDIICRCALGYLPTFIIADPKALRVVQDLVVCVRPEAL